MFIRWSAFWHDGRHSSVNFTRSLLFQQARWKAPAKSSLVYSVAFTIFLYTCNILIKYPQIRATSSRTIRRHNSNNPEDGLRDGQAVWQALEETYDTIINAARQYPDEEFDNTKMKHDFHVYTTNTARYILYHTGEHIFP